MFNKSYNGVPTYNGKVKIFNSIMNKKTRFNCNIANSFVFITFFVSYKINHKKNNLIN